MSEMTLKEDDPVSYKQDLENYWLGFLRLFLRTIFLSVKFWNSTLNCVENQEESRIPHHMTTE